MDDTDAELLQALVQGFDRAMLVSRCGEGMRSRPTIVANTDDNRRLWLLSGIVGDSLDELQPRSERERRHAGRRSASAR